VVGEEDVGEADGIGDEGGAVGRAVGYPIEKRNWRLDDIER
jgi:hypothetical protein